MSLPKHHFHHDSKWIAEQLDKLHPGLRERACDRYSEVYAATYDKAVVSYQKAGFARREANTRLRVFVGKYAASSHGKASLPPLA